MNPEKSFVAFFGQEPTYIDLLHHMALCGYCTFFGVTCALAATDPQAARLVLTSMALMCAFFLRFHYVVSPELNVILEDHLSILRKVWTGAMTVALVSLLMDANATARDVVPKRPAQSFRRQDVAVY